MIYSSIFLSQNLSFVYSLCFPNILYNKTYTVVIYSLAWKAKGFVHSSLIFGGHGGVTNSGSLPKYKAPQILDKGVNNKSRILLHYRINYDCKKFNITGPAEGLKNL
jgi:hypothetical protein